MRIEALQAEMRQAIGIAEQKKSRVDEAALLRIWFGKLEDVEAAEMHRDLTTEQAAFQLKRNQQTVARMCARGELDGAYRTNGGTGEWRIPQTTIEAYRFQRQNHGDTPKLWEKA